MTDQEMTRKFVSDLVSKYGYPEECVKSDVRIGSNVYDVAIQKGAINIQVFELKSKPKHEISYILNRFTEVSVDTPFYSVIFNDDGSWKLYDADNLSKPILNVKAVLNYKKAIANFFYYTQKDISDIIRSVKLKCFTCACFLLAYLAYYIVCDCEWCCSLQNHTPSKLSFEFLLYLCLICVIVLLPSVLQLLGSVRRIKIGSLLELSNEDDTPSGSKRSSVKESSSTH